jgi:hypothetical protein
LHVLILHIALLAHQGHYYHQDHATHVLVAPSL